MTSRAVYALDRAQYQILPVDPPEVRFQFTLGEVKKLNRLMFSDNRSDAEKFGDNAQQCLQVFLDDEDAIPFPEGSENRAKQLEMTKGTVTAYQLAKKYKVKTAWGSDCLFDAKLATRQGAQLAKLANWYTPYEILKMATSTNAELLALSGPRNPYPHKLGVIEEGAYADIILVKGNPLKNIRLIENPEENFCIIMKNGVIYKNILNDNAQ